MEFAHQTGKSLLEQYSQVERHREMLRRFRRILSIDDQRFDGDVMKAMLHVCLGHETQVLQASSLVAAADIVRQQTPDLIFLDDYLGRISTASESIGTIRKWGYTGPIIVVSALLSTKRRRELSSYGASGAIHKDDLSSVKIAEVLMSLAAG